MIQDFSIWEHESYYRLWDVCIIGSGINGLSTGISLLEKNPGTQVIILDRWFIPLGASTRNAGFSCFGSPSEILEDISKIGEEPAMALVSKRWRGLQKLRSRLEGSKAMYASHGGYELYHKDEYDKIQSSLPYLNGLMADIIGSYEVFAPIEVPSHIRGFDNAVYNSYEGQLHPGHMIEHLKHTYLNLGGHLWTGLQVDFIQEEENKVVVGSPLTIPIESKRLVVTTNAFASSLIKGLDIEGARNHVIVTSPIAGLSWKGCFHYDRGYYYFRNIGNRILLGGARNSDFETEHTNSFGRNEFIISILEEFLYEHLADRDSCKIDYQWSGIIGVGSQKLPIVKSVSPRVYIGLRCSGMGIALASLIGEELADLVNNSLDS